LSDLGTRFVSERDFVARFLLPELREAATRIGVVDLVDFYVEKSVDGIADLTAEKGGKGLFIVEAKFKKKVARIERDIEPLDPDVINQAGNYAWKGGFPFYATCNTKRMVLFQFRPGVKGYESAITSFEYELHRDWAETLLKTVLELVPVRLKPLDDTLVDALHDAFNDLYPEFSQALRTKLRDPKFKKRYTEWLESQGMRLGDETNGLTAQQTTYLQLNKLLFYQVIRVIYPDRLKPLKIDEEDDVQEALSRFFEDALKIDYDPIYQRDTISEIPLTARTQERIRTLLDTLNEFDFSRMESDFIGRIYEKLIPPAERKRLGQFYTPPGIVDLIVNLTITKPDDVVLDPGCGSGSFLVRAYHRLRELNNIPKIVAGPMGETHHRQILEQLYGIDINQFPAHLTVINLAVQNPKARIKKINAIVSDFFDVKPGARTLFGFKGMTTEGEPTVVTMPSAFDVIIANPPYIRQELLDEKEKVKIRSLIENEYPSRLSIGKPRKESKTEIVLDKQGDIYIYFYAHGIKFLKDGGRLGFISSNKWFEVDYGIPFQKFLLGTMKVLYVIEFDRAVFPDAEVNTAVVILQKETSAQQRHNSLVRFVRLKKKMGLADELELIQTNEDYEDDRVRVNVVRQGELVEGKWNVYLRAPPVYRQILRNRKIKPLEKVAADVFFGLKTGYNPFFILSKEDIADRGIENEFLKPILDSPKHLRGLALKKKDITHYVLSVDRNKSSLRGTQVLKYIEWGEAQKVEVLRGSERKPRSIPDLESVSTHRPFWYSVRELPEPDILIAQFSDKQLIVILNEARALASDNFLYVVCRNREDAKLVFGFLNSSMGALCGELNSRSYGGGVLKMQTYEAKSIPVLDPSCLTPQERHTVERAAEEYLDRLTTRVGVEGRVGEKEDRRVRDAVEAEEVARRKLDEAVYDVLRLTQEERKQVEESLKELQELRRLRTQA